MSEMKKMPYRLPEGAMEEMKIRSRAAVRRADAERTAHRRERRWVVSLAAAAVCLLVAIVGFMRFDGDALSDSPYYDELMSMMDDAPAEVIYEMTADVVWYGGDTNQL